MGQSLHDMDLTYTHYTPKTTGWIIEQTRTYLFAQDAETTKEVTYVSYWYGPNHGWGNTWSASLAYSVAVFPTMGAALKVAADFFGPMGGAKGMRARKVVNGELEEMD